MTKVLVAYATRQGSTREVAEAVAPAIREQAVTVDRRPARAVRKSAIGCDLVVLGAPVYSGRWNRDAHRFLKRHRKELLHVPVAVFGMGPRDGTEDSWRRSRSQLDRALAKHQWLAPAATALFGGVDPPRRPGQTRRDRRDWDEIRAWATEIPLPGA